MVYKTEVSLTHSPGFETTKVVKLKDSRSQQTAKGTCEGSHDDVERKAPSKLSSSVPSREIVCDTGEHAGFEDAEKKTHTRCGVDVCHESSTDGYNAEAERDGGNEPARTNYLAGHVGRDFEDDVGDVKY